MQVKGQNVDVQLTNQAIVMSRGTLSRVAGHSDSVVIPLGAVVGVRHRKPLMLGRGLVEFVDSSGRTPVANAAEATRSDRAFSYTKSQATEVEAFVAAVNARIGA